MDKKDGEYAQKRRLTFCHEEVLNFLPEKPPFLFIDKVSEVYGTKNLVGASVHASVLFNHDHPIFLGHFPQDPTLPGVIQIEIMAQAAIFTIALLEEDYLRMKINIALLSVASAKFKKKVYPNTEIKIHAECKKKRGTHLLFETKLFAATELVSSAEVLTQYSYTLN